MLSCPTALDGSGGVHTASRVLCPRGTPGPLMQLLLTLPRVPDTGFPAYSMPGVERMKTDDNSSTDSETDKQSRPGNSWAGRHLPGQATWQHAQHGDLITTDRLCHFLTQQGRQALPGVLSHCSRQRHSLLNNLFLTILSCLHLYRAPDFMIPRLHQKPRAQTREVPMPAFWGRGELCVMAGVGRGPPLK